MADTLFRLERITILLGGLFFAGSVTGYSQETGPTAQAAANAGMTSGLPAGVSSSSRQLDMMSVRSSAQGARYEAAAAEMARSADTAIEDRHYKSAMADAKENKRLKREATTRMKWQRSTDAYNKVSADQMSTWKDRRGNVRVERNVPNEFLLALRQEEAALAAESSRKQKRRGFNPLRATKKAITNVPVPFSKKASEPKVSGIRTPSAPALPESPEKSRGGFMKNIRAPKLPFSGVGRNKRGATVNQSPAPAASAQVGSARISTNAPKPGRVPEISGAALVDGRSSVGRGKPSVGSRMKKASDYGAAATQVSVPSIEPEKKKLFAKRKSSPSRSGSRFGFGKKKSKDDDRGTVDGSLFPSGASGQSANVRKLGTDSVASQQVAMQEVVPSSNVELPGQTRDRKPRRKFSMPKPSIPSISKADGASKKSKGPARPLTTINANGNDYYTVATQAQFMKYGASQMESEITVLPAGSLVRMTKPGAEWASIEMSDGTKGVIKVRNLQPASSGSFPSR